MASRNNHDAFRANSLQPTVPQKRHVEPRQTEELASVQPPSQTGSSAPAPPASVSTHPAPPTEAAPADAPPSKRRKIAKPQKQTVAARQTSSQDDPNVAIPTTETAEALKGGTAGPRKPSTPKKSAAKKRKSTAEKRKSHLEDAAARIVEDAISAKKRSRRPAEKKNATTIQQAEAENTENAVPELQGESSQAPAPAKARKARKSRGKQVIEDAAAGIVEDAVQGAFNDPNKRGKRSRRAVTPEEAEHERREATEVKMSELCADDGKGRKSVTEAQLREMDRAAFAKKKQEELQAIMGQSTPQPAAPEGTRLDRLGAQRQREEVIAMNVPNTVIVNGEIQIDQSSLRIDRHAIAAVERNAEQLTAVEETHLSRKTNYGSWVKRDKSGGWNEVLVDRFYDGLKMFGTDFGMISKMFPGKTRHAIKLKFCKEEKEDAARIRATLLGEKLPVELEEFQKMTGEEYEDPAILEQDMEDDRKKLEEEQEAEKEAIEAARRERAEQAEAERVAAQGAESSAKENRRKNRRKKGSKRSKRKEKDKEAPRTKARKPGLGEMLEGVGENGQAQVPEVLERKASSAKLKPLDLRR